MDIEKPKMWTCKKYELSVLESTAEAFCAKRFEASLEGRNDASYSSCVNCDRGAIMYELGKHKGQGSGETKQTKTETIQAKGETTMATNSKGGCKTEGCGKTVQKEGLCYKCYKARHGVAPYPGQDHKKTGTKKARRKTVDDSSSLVPHPSTSKPLELAGGGHPHQHRPLALSEAA